MITDLRGSLNQGLTMSRKKDAEYVVNMLRAMVSVALLFGLPPDCAAAILAVLEAAMALRRHK